ncbi:type II toxin-antitoxin system HicB family antitoxin [Breznakiellaceae bacterium SP9]
MRKTTYLAVFEPVADGSYSVYFPDVAACISCGANFEHAHKMAEQALSLHLYALEKQGEAFPSVSELPQIEPETAWGYIVAPVTVFPDIVRNNLDSKSLKTTIMIPA